MNNSCISFIFIVFLFHRYAYSNTDLDIIENNIKPKQYNEEKLEINRAVHTNVNINNQTDSNITGLYANKSDLDKVPEKFDSIIEEAIKAFKVGNLKNSLALYEKALSIKKDDSDALCSIGVIYHKNKDIEKAVQYYKAALKSNPGNHICITNYIVAISNGNQAYALKALHALEKINNSFAPIHAQIGILYASINNFAQARYHLKKAMELDSDDLRYIYNLAVLYDKNGDYDSARQIYMKLISKSGNNKNDKLNLQEVYQRVEFLDSIAIYDK